MRETITASMSETDAASNSRWLSPPTVADGLYAFALIAAAVMRFVDLGKLPLGPSEAEAALATWRFWQPEIGSLVIPSPAYFALTSLLSQVLGFTDGVMRLVPALFGLGLVLLPRFLEDWLGKIGAAVCGLLLAVSPLQSVVARTAGGDAIALFALLLIFVAWSRYQVTANVGWFYALLAGLGLGMVSSALFYGGIVSLALAWLAHALSEPWFSRLWTPVRPNAKVWRRALAYGAAVLIAGSTLFLAYPTGLGSALTLPAEWLAQFTLSPSEGSLLDPLLAIGRYEIVMVVPGIATIIWAIGQKKPLGLFCLYWMLSVAVLALLQGGQLNYAPLFTLPGYLLLALFISDTLDSQIDVIGWALAGGIVIFGGVTAVNLARYSRVVIFDPQQIANVWIALFSLTIVLAAIYYVATWHAATAYQGTLLGVLILAMIYQWGTGWWLSHLAANDPRERWVSVATDEEVRILVDVLTRLSQQVTGTDSGIDILGAMDAPQLRWYLRDFSNASMGDALPANVQNAVVITKSGADLSTGSDYLGADFGLIRRSPSPESFSQNPVLDTLRWWLFHESSVDFAEERIVMWWRSDLVEG